jgi:holin-like protein
MIPALTLLLGCQLVGEVVARGLGLPVPGPVLGLALLLVSLFSAARFGWVTPETVDNTGLGRVAGVLLGALGLMFVPAGAGVVHHAELLANHGLALLAALVGSTLITLVVTVAVFRLIARRSDQS